MTQKQKTPSKYNFLVIGAGFSGIWVKDILEHKKYCFKQYDHHDHVPVDQLEQYSHVICPPGMFDTSLIKQCRKLLIPVMGDLDLLYFLNPNAIFIGVTGSCGKTTFTHQLKHIFHRYLSEKSHLCGNMGVNPFLEKSNIYIIEVSSFQLDKNQFIYFDYFIVLNIYDTHKERYCFYQEYLASKIRPIVQGQCKKSIVNYNNEYNINTMLQLVCKEFNISKIQIENALNNFKKPNTRQEYIKVSNDLTVINDSSSTNLMSLEYAINSLNCDYVLCGGASLNSHKTDFTIKCQVLFTFSIGGIEILNLLKENGSIDNIKYREHFNNLEQALLFIKQNKNTIKGKLLFSPGCQSFGEFRNYKERNEFFMTKIQEL